MDEFHSFNDPERGIVWELTLGLLPEHVRTLLLSATVGNAVEFLHWLSTSHKRKLELVAGGDRKVPLKFHWVGDMLLTEHLEEMAQGEDAVRMTPALVFCFNREECWTVAEQLKGKRVLSDGQQKRLAAELERYDWSEGAGPKLKQLLIRGVGVHHAGVLPKYRRVVEELFQRKLLSVATCTETLSAGINLPARSVVVPSIMKGPPDKKKLLDPSTAHQIFGRAGRPQFDKEGHVYVLAHEDDVKIARWREKYDQIPEDTKDPGLMKAKKALKKKMPTRRANEQYWNEAQFNKLCAAPPGNLYSRGPLPWRLLAYMLDASPEVDIIRRLVGKRLMDPGRIEAGQRRTRSAADDALADRLRDARTAAAHRSRACRDSSRRSRRKGQGGETARFHVRFRRKAEAHGRRAAAVQADARPADREHGQAAAVPRHQPAVRHLPDQPVGHRRPQRADPGDGERVGVAAARWAISSACRGKTNCRPARWPRCGSMRNCCSLAWRRPKSFRRTLGDEQDDAIVAAWKTTASANGC